MLYLHFFRASDTAPSLKPTAKRAKTPGLKCAVRAVMVTWLLACGGLALAQRSSALPALGDGSELAAGAERRLGDRIAASIYRDPEYLEDPVLDDYLQDVWQPLVIAARKRGELSPELEERFAWQLFLARNRTVNAFALPGGYLGVHTGLIAVVSNADELAAVLGHELSHVTQRHISRLMTQQQRQAPWLVAAMILGVLAASKNPDAAGAAIVGGQAVAAQGQLNFSRDMEREADRIGSGVMTDAGFDARGVTGMFEKLQQASRLNDSGGFPYLRSHPLTTERLAEASVRAQSAAAQHSAGGVSHLSGMAHALMAGRAIVLGEPGVDALQALLAQARLLPTGAAASTAPNLTTLYAAALAASRLRDFDTAAALCARLQAIVASDVRAARAARLLSIELAMLAGRPAQAAAASDWGQASTRAELLVEGRALLAAQRGAEVADKLQGWVTTHPRDAGAWQLLSAAYAQQGQTLRAVRADAESRVAQFDYAAALDRFKAAQDLMRSASAPGNAAGQHIEASIIDTRTRQVQLLLREQALQDKLDR